MANTAYSVNGVVIDFKQRDTVPQFTLMQPALCNTGRALYVQANNAIAASQSDITVATTGQASDGSGTWSNMDAFADNEYGWVWLAEPNT